MAKAKKKEDKIVFTIPNYTIYSVCTREEFIKELKEHQEKYSDDRDNK